MLMSCPIPQAHPPSPLTLAKSLTAHTIYSTVKIISLKDTYNYLVCTASNRLYRSRLQGESCCQSSVILAQIGKQSNSKWLAHTNRLLPILSGTLQLNMNSIHFTLVSSEAGRLCTDLCWFVQPTTAHLEGFICSMLIASFPKCIWSFQKWSEMH